MVRAATNQRTLFSEVTNGAVAERLEETADLLARQGANEFRVAAYRRGAATLREIPAPVAQLYGQLGPAGLRRLPGIGESLSTAIEQMVTTGHLDLLERLRAEASPARIFTSVADIGPKLAARIHQELGIGTLAELEAAACDGRLSRVPGMGAKRVRAVRESLAGRFRQRLKRPGVPTVGKNDPPVAEILDIDAEYCRLAAKDRLMRIAPRRYNPEGKAWLPILHAERDGRRYTAMFSNTARAHEFGATHDWVIIARDSDQFPGQWTVITSQMGKLRGRRVVRGREAECGAWYEVK